ncbi:hypothetical protein SLEP1_g47067 [Rubroshorea leprosula]|uniref:Pentatricopeptide repeat-containing protein n=1 Tax=Rubroshorea leprosula TaxID=152421 RepID=A0AAV5LP83_9ROSI|nr:hypothetical protein SLEP1_g47067 [Rubroshorea leprosula]
MASIFKDPKLFLPKSLFFSTFCTQKPPFPSFKAAKSAIVSESDPEKLAEIFKQCSQFPKFLRHRPIYDYSIRKLARAGRLDLVDQVLQTQKTQQVDTPVLKSEGFWIRLMMLYSNAGLADKALETFEELCQKKYCNVTEKSLCAVLSVYLDNGSLDKVNECFEEMPKKLGVNPGIVSHNLVLKSLVKQKRIESARNWIEKMEKDGKVVPNIDSYNIILGAYLKIYNMKAFDEIMREVVKKGIECNFITYNHRITRLCWSKKGTGARKLLEEMVEKGLKPNSVSYNSVIDCFCRVGDFESAKKLLEKMLADGYVLPCSFTYYTMIRSMVKEGEFEQALEICKEIIKRRWIPPFEAVEGLVKGLAEMSKVEEAKDVVEKMKKRLKGEALDSWGKIEATLPL